MGSYGVGGRGIRGQSFAVVGGPKSQVTVSQSIRYSGKIWEWEKEHNAGWHMAHTYKSYINNGKFGSRIFALYCFVWKLKHCRRCLTWKLANKNGSCVGRQKEITKRLHGNMNMCVGDDWGYNQICRIGISLLNAVYAKKLNKWNVLLTCLRKSNNTCMEIHSRSISPFK